MSISMHSFVAARDAPEIDKIMPLHQGEYLFSYFVLFLPLRLLLCCENRSSPLVLFFLVPFLKTFNTSWCNYVVASFYKWYLEMSAPAKPTAASVFGLDSAKRMLETFTACLRGQFGS